MLRKFYNFNVTSEFTLSSLPFDFDYQFKNVDEVVVDGE